MYKVVVIVLTVFMFLQNQITLQQENDVKDVILEFFYNCTCTPLYLCTHINSVMEASRRNMLLKDSINCTGISLICCNNTEITEPVVTEKPIIDVNETDNKPNKPKENETVEVRRPVFSELGCGIAKTVIGVRLLTTDKESEETITGEAPWIVEVFQKKNNPKQPYKLKCAGSLIHKKVVLTANHCVVSNKPEKLIIVATGLENFQNVGVKQANERNVTKIIKHPKYYSGGLHNDIALLILDQEYQFGGDSLLNAICLPNQNQSFNGGKCLAMGWGENLDLESLPLKKVDVPVIESEQCQNLLRKTSLGSKFNLHSSFMCAGGEEGKDTCKGDGGGPLMCLGEEKDRFVVSGLVSWGVNNKCGIVDQPGLYTDVAQFVDWIYKELEKNDIKLNNT